jgi:WD40 repeat protein
LIGHKNKINCLAITSDDERIITGSDDNTAIIWNMDTGEKL